MPWLHGKAWLLSCMALLACRHCWMPIDAIDVSPAPPKCSETHSAVRSREWPLHWEINLVVSGSSRESISGKYSQLAASPCLPMPYTGLVSMQSGYKQSNRSGVKSPDNRELALCCSQWSCLCSQAWPKSKPGFLEWMEWKIRSSWGTYHTKPRSEASYPCTSFIPFSTWCCKLHKPMAVFLLGFFPLFPSIPLVLRYTNNAT